MHYCTNYFLIYEKFLLIYYKIRGMMPVRKPSAQGPPRKPQEKGFLRLYRPGLGWRGGAEGLPKLGRKGSNEKEPKDYERKGEN